MAGAESSGDSSASKSLMWMMIAMVIGVAVLLGGGLLLASRVLNVFHMQESGDKPTMRTPMGDVRVEKASEAGQALPVYPRATLVLPGSDGKFAALPSPEYDTQSAAYYSADSSSFVQDWYREHLGPEFTWHGPEEAPRLEALNAARISNSAGAFVAEHDDRIRIAAIEEDPSGTHIRLVQMRKRAAH